MRNIVVFHDFVGKIEKAFMLNTANNCHIPLNWDFIRLLLRQLGKLENVLNIRYCIVSSLSS